MKDILKEDFTLCEDMKCPAIIKSDDCIPSQCQYLDDEFKRTGAIYFIDQNGEEHFIVKLYKKK